MKLLIISNMAHHKRNEQIVGWGPTVEEINQLSSIFDEVRHIACLHNGDGPDSFLPYGSNKIQPILVPPAGGERLSDKMAILRMYPTYLRVMLQELSGADVVHVRCPANLSLLALLVLWGRRHPRVRWIKYAGDWSPKAQVAWSSKLQRMLLNHGLHRGWVTVNGRWPGQPYHVRSFFNPCLHRDDFLKLRDDALRKELNLPIRIIFAGRLAKVKGTDRAIRIIEALTRRGIPVHLDLFGDGAERCEFEKLAVQLQISDLTTFHGWLPAPSLLPHYLSAHFVLLPSDSEGLPKVLGEGMACGAIPIASGVGSIPQTLDDLGIGRYCDRADINGYTTAINEYLANPDRWRRESRLAVQAADLFTYEHYLQSVQDLLLSSRRGSYRQSGV